MENLPVISVPNVVISEDGTTEGIVVPVVFGAVRVTPSMLYNGDIGLAKRTDVSPTDPQKAVNAKLKQYGDMAQAYLVAVWFMICMGIVYIRRVLANDKFLNESQSYYISFFNNGTGSFSPTLTSTEALVTVGKGGHIYTTLDKVHWQDNFDSGVTTDDLYMVRRLNGIFIAVGNNGTIIYSIGGTVWAKATSNTTVRLNDVAYGLGIYVAVGSSGEVVTSTDAVTWTNQSQPMGTSYDCNQIVFNQANFVVVMGLHNSVNPDGRIYTSADASFWTLRLSPARGLYAVTWIGTGWLAVGGDVYFSADDGLTWTLKFNYATNPSYYAATVTFAPGLGSPQGTIVFTDAHTVFSSIDGATTMQLSFDNGHFSLYYGSFWDAQGQKFYVMTDGNAFFLASSTGLYHTWTQSFTVIGGTMAGNPDAFNFTYTSKLKGIAHMYFAGPEITLGADTRVVFNSGNEAPAMRFDVERVAPAIVDVQNFYEDGVLIGNSPLNVIAEVLTNVQWGLGVDVSILDLASFNAVSGNFGDQRNYGISTIVDSIKTAKEILSQVFDLSDVFVYAENGAFVAKSMYNVLDLVLGTFVDDDFISPIHLEKQSWLDVDNEFEGEYVDSTMNYEKKTIIVKNEAAIDMSDGLIRKKKVDLTAFVTKTIASQRLHELMQRESRPKTRFSCTVNSSWDFLRPGDRVAVQSDEYGISGNFRVVSIGFPEMGDLTITLDLQQAFEELYDGNFRDPMAAQGIVPQNIG